MSTADASLNAQEREDLMQLLRDSETQFLDLTRSLTAEQWTAQPGPDGWSIQQTAEHLIAGEARMVGLIEKALSAPPQDGWEAEDSRKAQFLTRVLPDRSRKAISPEPLRPVHNWNRDEALQKFREGRQRTRELAARLDGPVKNRLAEHPFPIFNKLNVHHWLLYIPLHNIRHNQQIAEALKRVPA